MRIIVAAMIIGGGLLTMSIAEAQQPAAPGNDPNFTGVVTTVDAKDMNGESPLGWASWHTRPDAILRKLCYGDFYVRPDRSSSFDHGLGWGMMERDLLGTPRVGA